MKFVKLSLKFAILTLGLATLHAMQTPKHHANYLCRVNAEFCSTGTSGGHCGFRAGEDCNTCYGIDGSTLSGGCPQPD